MSIKKQMRIFWLICCITLLLSSMTVLFSASAQSYSWYCVHRKDHMQPEVPELCFVENYDGFYIDRKHGDDCQDKVIYLTFDAGYENGNVSKILDVLQKENVQGAFFVLGNLIEKDTELINRMFAEGHLVCNHTYSHKAMSGVSREIFQYELSRLEVACLEKTGRELSKFYRPPEGRFDENSLQFAKDMGYKTVFWSFAYADWDNNAQPSPEKAKKKILENIHNGEIMLLHPTSDVNAVILEDVIRDLKAQGYRFGSLNEL